MVWACEPCHIFRGVPYGPKQVFFDNFKFAMIFIIGMGTFFPVVSGAAFGVKMYLKPL